MEVLAHLADVRIFTFSRSLREFSQGLIKPEVGEQLSEASIGVVVIGSRQLTLDRRGHHAERLAAGKPAEDLPYQQGITVTERAEGENVGKRDRVVGVEHAEQQEGAAGLPAG